VHNFLQGLVGGAAHFALHPLALGGNFFLGVGNHPLTEGLTIPAGLVKNLSSLIGSLPKPGLKLGLGAGGLLTGLVGRFDAFADEVFTVIQGLGNFRPSRRPERANKETENHKGPDKSVGRPAKRVISALVGRGRTFMR